MRFSRKVYIIFCLFCLIGVWQTGVRPAHAQNDMTSIEEIWLAFYKTGGVVPNFSHWVKNTDPYLATVQTRREEVYERELRRLQEAYRNFDLDTAIITIKTDIRGRLDTLDDRGGAVLMMEFTRGHIDYFPYEFLGQVIAVIPHELQNNMSAFLKPDQALQVLQHMPADQIMELSIELRPRRADLTRPYPLDGTEQWLFLNDIAALALRNKEGILLWEYTAPWYITPNQQTISDLK